PDTYVSLWGQTLRLVLCGRGLRVKMVTPASSSGDSPTLRPLFGLQVDHDVHDRDREALAGMLDDPTLEPVRPAFGVRGDDDLVCAEGPERILDRLQRVSVPDLSPRFDADRAELSKAPLQARLGGCPRAVLF